MLLSAWPVGGKMPPNTGSLIHTQAVPEKRLNWRFFILVVAFVLYLIIGAVIFSTIEAPKIEAISDRVQLMRKQFLVKHPCVSENDLEKLLEMVILASQHGISALKNSSNEMNWSFGQSLFFSTTVVTTIGYGHVAPISDAGKTFCIVYAMIGIPFILILLSASVERLMGPSNWILGLLNTKLGHLYQPFNIRLLHLSIIVVIIGILFLLIPSFVFAFMEPKWDLLDAFYYCFISLTTIGLGDYIPGDEPDQKNRFAYKIGTTIYLILGLIAMMLILTIFYEIPQLNLSQLFSSDVLQEEDDDEKIHCLKSNSPPRCYSSSSGINKISGLFTGPRNAEVQRSVVKIRPHGIDDDEDEDTSPNDHFRPSVP